MKTLGKTLCGAILALAILFGAGFTSNSQFGASAAPIVAASAAAQPGYYWHRHHHRGYWDRYHHWHRY
jgi:hypothetical protein